MTTVQDTVIKINALTVIKGKKHVIHSLKNLALFSFYFYLHVYVNQITIN